MRKNLLRLRRPLTKKTWAIVGLVIAGLLLAGGGAYAALGGSIRPKASGDIELQRGLVGWWKLDGNAKDSTPNANNGSVSGATLTPDRKGRANSAYSFDGINDKLSATATNIPTTLQSQSLQAWIRPTSIDGTARDIIVLSNASPGQLTQFRISTGGLLQVSFSGGGITITGTTVLNTNTWYLATYTWDGTSSRLYLNGSLETTNANPPQSSDAAVNTVYMGTYGGWEYFAGSIDDLRIYNRALSLEEIDALYENYDSGVQAASGQNGLIGHWKLDGNPKDSTPNSNNTSIAGTTGPTPTADRKGKVNGAYTFDGTPSSSGYLVDSANTIYDSDANKPRTYSIWFRAPSNPAQNANMLYKSANCIGWNMQMNTNGTLSFITTAGTSGCTGYSTYSISWGAASYSDGNWHLATYVVDRPNSTAYGYVDGILKNSIAISNTLTSANTGTLRIGTSWNNGNPWKGDLDDARIYGRALSAAEVMALYQSYDSQINLNSSPTANTSGGNINQGLVGYWPFSGNARDATPYSNNGTVTGAALTNDRLGRPNSAYSFTGNPDAVKVANTSELNPASTMSLSAWFRSNTGKLGAVAGQRIVSTYNSGTPTGYAFIITGSSSSDPCGAGVICFRVFIGGTGVVASVSSSSLVDGSWYYLTGTYDGSAVRLYINGSQVARTNASGAISTSTMPLCIGAGPGGANCNTNYLNGGGVDEVRIYGRALSATEVATLYASNN